MWVLASNSLVVFLIVLGKSFISYLGDGIRNITIKLKKKCSKRNVALLYFNFYYLFTEKLFRISIYLSYYSLFTVINFKLIYNMNIASGARQQQNHTKNKYKCNDLTV